MAGQLTIKADVYSFGILILEIVSGRSSSKADLGGSQKFLLEWVSSSSEHSIRQAPASVIVDLDLGLSSLIF